MRANIIGDNLLPTPQKRYSNTLAGAEATGFQERVGLGQRQGQRQLRQHSQHACSR